GLLCLRFSRLGQILPAQSAWFRIFSRQGAKTRSSEDYFLSFAPLRLCGRSIRVWLRLARAGWIAAQLSPCFRAVYTLSVVLVNRYPQRIHKTRLFSDTPMSA